MGFQDRDYNRVPYDDYGYRKRRTGGGWSMTMKIIIINVILFFANGLFFPDNYLSQLLRVHVFAIANPVLWWEFLTYGFTHSPTNAWHIVGNMFCLLMFARGYMLGIGPNGFGIARGSNVEDRLGPWEFLAFYLITIIIGGITNAMVDWQMTGASIAAMKEAAHMPNWYELGPGAWGASGGVTGVVILYAMLYPDKMMLLFGIVPMPMWMLGAFIVFMDAMGAAGHGEQGIGYSVHLAGAACAAIYYFGFLQNNWSITGGFNWSKLFPRHKPKLKVYKVEEPKQNEKVDEEYNKRLDRILGRHGEVGWEGLTPEEREFLKKASQKFKDKK